MIPIVASLLGTLAQNGLGLLSSAIQAKGKEVVEQTLGVKITDPQNRSRKINHIMIPKNTSIPFEVRQKFVTTSMNQQRIHVTVLEGDAVDPDACEQIGDFYITGLPLNLPAGSPVEVTYSYDSSGRISCSAIELTSKKAASTEIIRTGLQTKDVDVFEVLAKDYQVE